MDDTEFSTDEHMQLMYISLKCDQDSILLFSSQADEKEAVSIASLADHNHARLIAVTSYHSAQLQQLCDVFIPAVHQKAGCHDLFSSRYSMALIMDLLLDCCKAIRTDQQK